MEATFAEWRRGGSPTRGGLVLAWQDLQAGSGWGVIEHTGEPKAAWYGLKRAWRPMQLAMTDEGVNGLDLHLINEGPAPVSARVELACLREGQVPILSASREVTLAPRSVALIDGFDLVGSFFDLTYAYHFGPPEHDAVTARLIGSDDALLAEAVYFPQGRGATRPAPNVTARAERDGESWVLVLATDWLAQSVHIADPGFRPDDDWFHLTPRRERRVRLHRRPATPAEAIPSGEARGLGGRWRAAY